MRVHLLRAAIVLAFINYQLHYEAVFNDDLSVGMMPQLAKSTDEFQLGISEIVAVCFAYLLFFIFFAYARLMFPFFNLIVCEKFIFRQSGSPEEEV